MYSLELKLKAYYQNTKIYKSDNVVSFEMKIRNISTIICP